jgi:hypothetical protein
MAMRFTPLRGVLLLACCLIARAAHQRPVSAHALGWVAPLGFLPRSQRPGVCGAGRRSRVGTLMCAPPAETVVDRAEGWVRGQTFGELFKKQEVKNLLKVCP